VSAALQANGSAGMTYLVHLDGETEGLAWATVVSLLGLPADPQWGDVVLGGMRLDRLIRRLDGIGCNPAVIQGTREEVTRGNEIIVRPEQLLQFRMNQAARVPITLKDGHQVPPVPAPAASLDKGKD
jgi:hypothetical protein